MTINVPLQRFRTCENCIVHATQRTCDGTIGDQSGSEWRKGEKTAVLEGAQFEKRCHGIARLVSPSRRPGTFKVGNRLTTHFVVT